MIRDFSAYEVELSVCNFCELADSAVVFVMFTPRKGFQGWSLSPKSGSHKSGTGSGQNPVGEKGKTPEPGSAPAVEDGGLVSMIGPMKYFLRGKHISIALMGFSLI